VVTVIQFPAIYQGVSEKDHHGLSLIFPNNWFLRLKIGWVMKPSLLHSKLVFDIGDLDRS